MSTPNKTEIKFRPSPPQNQSQILFQPFTPFTCVLEGEKGNYKQKGEEQQYASMKCANREIKPFIVHNVHRPKKA